MSGSDSDIIVLYQGTRLGVGSAGQAVFGWEDKRMGGLVSGFPICLLGTFRHVLCFPGDDGAHVRLRVGVSEVKLFLLGVG